MTILEIILIISGIITGFSLIICIYLMVEEMRMLRVLNGNYKSWRYLLIGLFIIPIMVYYGCKHLHKYIIKVWKIVSDTTGKQKVLLSGDKERINDAYLNGIIRRDEVERYLNGETAFELKTSFPNMHKKLIYVENEYNETFHKFFKKHGSLVLKYDVRVIYLPEYVEYLVKQNMVKYFIPWIDDVQIPTFSAQDVLQYIFSQLSYPDDVKKLRHGLFLFSDGYQYNKYLMEVYSAEYYPLEEGDDNYIMSQLLKIVEEKYGSENGHVYYHLDENEVKEDVSDDFADYNCHTIYSNKGGILIKEVRERVEKLHQCGISPKLLFDILKTPAKLSRLVITKDYRIILPDYGAMEIKMEPINKAVYFLFLRHPEGIIFKYLPDYEQELLDIYSALKPNGINDRVRKSISDVCNPCKNSINEKCARIRGAFISQFDESLARNYFVTGYRGEPKNVKLPFGMIIWDKNINKEPNEEFERDVADLAQASPFGVMRKTTFGDIKIIKNAIIEYFEKNYPDTEIVWNAVDSETCNVSFSVNDITYNALVEIWGTSSMNSRYVTEEEYNKLLSFCESNDSVPCLIAVEPYTGKIDEQHTTVTRIAHAKTSKAIDFNKHKKNCNHGIIEHFHKKEKRKPSKL